MKKILVVIAIIALVGGCIKSNNVVVAQPNDDWELAGDKDGCKLYTKLEYGSRVYWSICTFGNSTSSVSIR